MIGTYDAERIKLTTTRPAVPPSRQEVKDWLTPGSTGSLPKFAICLKPSDGWPKNAGANENFFKSAPAAIGFLNFQDGKFDYKNRIAYLGISIVDAENTGKGYGREAVEWALEYAFMELGLHRVALDVYSFNENAVKLYRKM